MIYDLHIWTHSPVYKKVVSAVKSNRYSTINLISAEEHSIEVEWANTKGFKLIEQFAKENTLNIVFGCVEDEHFYNRGGLCKGANHYPWPTFWVYNTVHNRNNIKITKPDKGFRFNFVLLNRKAHEHRCMLVDQLASRNLLKHGAVSWHYTNTEYDWKYWTPKRLILDKDVIQNDFELLHLPGHHYKSFCSVVSESTTEVIFITEKTVMPIISKTPFIVHAASGFHSYLQSLGFELYSEIFDYSFDSDPDDNARAIAIADNVQRLNDLDLKSTYQKLKPKIEHNYQLALSIAYDITRIPDVVLDYAERKGDTVEYHWLKHVLGL